MNILFVYRGKDLTVRDEKKGIHDMLSSNCLNETRDKAQDKIIKGKRLNRDRIVSLVYQIKRWEKLTDKQL